MFDLALPTDDDDESSSSPKIWVTSRFFFLAKLCLGAAVILPA
jgi:hypothetical protein